MNYEKTKIRLLEGFIRNIVSEIIQKIDFGKLEETGRSFLTKTQDRFRFDDEKGIKFLNSSLDVVGDAQIAIVTFENFKIENEKQFNTGERYLRLYGLLSAVYIQQQAIMKLSDLVKTNNFTENKTKFDRLEITFLRHCISAHPINFKTENKKSSFKIDRNSINNNGDLSIRDENNKSRIYNVFKAIQDYKEIAELYLFDISIKLIENAYKSSEEKKKELISKVKIIKYGRQQKT